MEKVLAKADSHSVVDLHQVEHNLGRGRARNYAISKAKHTLISIMDADDISRPDRFEKQLHHLVNSDTDILGGYIEEFKQFPGDYQRKRVCKKTHKEIVSSMPFRNPFNNVTTMFKRRIFNQIGGYKNLNFVEDWDLFARAAKAGAKFSNLPDVLVDVRINPNKKL